MKTAQTNGKNAARRIRRFRALDDGSGPETWLTVCLHPGGAIPWDSKMMMAGR